MPFVLNTHHVQHSLPILFQCRLDRGPGKGEEVGARTSVFVAKIGPLMTDEVLGQLFAHLGPVVAAKVNRYADKKAEGWG